jgi:uncharacterized protein
MPGTFQIDYLEFPSKDGKATRKFLEEAFDWSFVTYSPTYEGVSNAGIDLGVDSDTASMPAAPLAVVRTTDLEAAQRRVVVAGGVITQPAYDFPGGRRFHFREPGGNELAVWIAVE